jgi:ubiquinone/menaquinone biosynthesis C-methylase UbiE
MNLEILKENIEGVDIYIIDQILKNRYKQGDKILDAGCGSGRNLKWFYKSGYQIYGIDKSFDDIEHCQVIYKNQKLNFKQASLENIPFETNNFDHILCNAVLHFAEDLSHYLKMFEELFRILKPGGSLFIRMASNFGMENEVEFLSKGVYKLPDGTTRFLLTQQIFDDLLKRKDIKLLEELKTTIVYNKRCMSTLVIQKE